MSSATSTRQVRTYGSTSIIPQAQGSSIRPPSVIPSLHTPTTFQPSLRASIQLQAAQAFSIFVSSFFLFGVVIWALATEIYTSCLLRSVSRKVFDWDSSACKEKIVKEVQPYARAAGFEIIDEQVETADGYYLRVHRVVNPRHRPGADGRGGYPVLILHGLFQSSGSFITSEDRSLAFWLSEHGGYQVFLGNTRGVFNMGHRHYSRSDPRFWDWTIRELANYDFPALIDYVRDATGYDRIAFIGHSQGNGLAFLSLSAGMRPDLGPKISSFVALAPAVFAGPLTHGFPFTVLSKLNWARWRLLFGTLDFIPLMQWSYNHVPPTLFAALGYTMFAFLFGWTDTNWLLRRKTKMFRFTPSPVSSASIFWWCGSGGFAERKCIMDVTLDRWWQDGFPPLSVFGGGKDYLVCVDSLLERIKDKEPNVTIVRLERIEDSEHCDFYWAAEAVEWCFHLIKEDIEHSRLRSDEDILLLN